MNKTKLKQRLKKKLNQEHMHIVLERNGQILRCELFFLFTLSFHSNDSNTIYQCKFSHHIFFSTDFLFYSHRSHTYFLL